MKFAIDYDKTFTADPVLFEIFINVGSGRGHVFDIVTMRFPHEEIVLTHTASKLIRYVIYTEQKAKIAYCKKKGLEYDIWIDDAPIKLFEDYGVSTIK